MNTAEIIPITARLLTYLAGITETPAAIEKVNQTLLGFTSEFLQIMAQSTYMVPTIFTPVLFTLMNILKILNRKETIPGAFNLIAALRTLADTAPALSVLAGADGTGDMEPGVPGASAAKPPLVPYAVFDSALDALTQVFGDGIDTPDAMVCQNLLLFGHIMETGTGDSAGQLITLPDNIAITPFTHAVILALLAVFPLSDYEENTAVVSTLECLRHLLVSPENPEPPDFKDNAFHLRSNAEVFQSALAFVVSTPEGKAFEPVLVMFQNMMPLMDPYSVPESESLPVAEHALHELLALPSEFVPFSLIRLLMIPLISTLHIKNSQNFNDIYAALIEILTGLMQAGPLDAYDSQSPEELVANALTEAANAYVNARNSLDYTFNPGNFEAYGHNEGPSMRDLELLMSLITQINQEGTPLDGRLGEMLVSLIVSLFDTISFPRGLNPDVYKPYIQQHLLTLRDAGIILPEHISAAVENQVYCRLLELLSQQVAVEEQIHAADIALKRHGRNMEQALIAAGFSEAAINNIKIFAQINHMSFPDYIDKLLQSEEQRFYSKKK